MGRNEAQQYVPVREDRRKDSPAALSSAISVLDIDLSGDESAIVAIAVVSALTATVQIQLSFDGINFDPYPFYPLIASGGTIPVLSQPMISEVFAAVAGGTRRVYAIQTTGARKLRVAFTSWTSGSMDVKISASPNQSIHPNVMMNKASTLMVSSLSAAGAALTLTLPAVPGFRHYIDSLEITREASALLTAGAATTNVSTTNLPGTAANQLVFGQDAAPQGNMALRKLDAGGSGLAVLAINTATTIVMPLTTGVIWHANCIYRLGL